ncbi:MAG TPA: RagB/SusD family nutrient uptake outer membrane protein [Balneolaceae bacterium]|nr:RagB/SusD family nutrient uptake outer membrane protein [Balneolaceae bacterium]
MTRKADPIPAGIILSKGLFLLDCLQHFKKELIMRNLYIALFALIFVAGSCNDILNVEPLDSVSDSNTWNDPELLELYVNSRYDELPHGFVQWAGGLRVTSLTDESYDIHQGSRLVNKYTQGEITPTNMHLFGGFWIQAYSAIRNLNLFLEKADPELGDPDRTAQLIAEVRFLRAWFYTELFSRYGEIPLLDYTVSVEGANQILERSPVAEVVSFIESELTEAAEILPETYSGEDFGKATKGASIALKARALLYAASPLFGNSTTDEWQKVADACEELFDLDVYSLSEDYQAMFLDVQNPEIIFFKQFSQVRGPEINFEMGYYMPSGGHNIDEWRLPNGNNGWSQENPLMNLIDVYETTGGEIPVLGYTGNENDLSPVLNSNAVQYDPANPYDNRDPRLSYSVVYDGSMINDREVEFWECGTDSRCDEVDSWWNGPLIDHTIRKGLDLDWQTGTGLNSNTPYIYMRLAEFYLTYAEAQFHLGNTGTAEEYVNRVRSRPGVNMPPIESSQTGSDLLTKIKHERKVELAFEGNRWYDARRWLDAETEFSEDAVGLEVIRDEVTGDKSYRYFVQQQRSFPSSHYLFPIPNEEINKTNWTQNPGY